MIPWIKRLPAGEYDMKTLIKFAGLKPCSHGSVKFTMVYYGAKIVTVPVNGNLKKNIYQWTGYKEKWRQ